MNLPQFTLATAVVLLTAVSPRLAQAGTFLLTEYEFGPTAYTDIKSTLESQGHIVDIVNATVDGNITTALSSKSYDSVFLFDLSAGQYLDGTDLDSLKSFWNNHKSLVVDTRSYGYYFQGTQASEVALLQNIAEQFDARGGGVWVGTDHDAAWTRNGNPFLLAIGVNPVTGIHSEAVNAVDPASVLLDGVTPTQLWAAGQSVGTAPLGIQPNGLDMRFHFGHSSPASGAIPYITASFGTFVAPDEDPDSHLPPDGGEGNVIPEPMTMAMLGGGLLGTLFTRRRRQR